MSTNRRTLSVLSWLAALVAAAWLVRGTPISHDLTQFMPRGASPQQQLAVELLRQGPASRSILVALQGAATSELARVSRNMALRLRMDSGFARVANGVFDAGRDLEPVFRYRYLLDPSTGPDRFSAEALAQALGERLDELRGPLALLDKPQVAADPTAAARAVLAAWKPANSPRILEGVWFAANGQRALLIATVRASAFDSEAQQAAVAAIHQAFAAVNPPTTMRLEMTGSPVFADAARTTIRSELQTLSLAGGTIVVVLLLIAYRSPRLVLLSGLPLASALLAGAAATASLFGSLHGITLVFGMTLLGVAIDYPIHLFSHLAGAATAREAMRRIWPTLRLGVVTTCVAYLAFARRDFAGLAQLGVFTTSGLLAAAAVTRWILPAFIGVAPRTKVRVPRGLLLLPRRAARLLIGVASLGAAAILLLVPPAWETELSALSPISAEARALGARLRRELGAADVSQLLVVNGTELEQVLQDSERVARQLQQGILDGLLSGVDYAARYLPSVASQRLRQQALPDDATLQRALHRALQGLPFKPGGFDPFLRDVASSRQLPPLTFEMARHTPIASRIEPLLSQTAGGWRAIITLHGIEDVPAFHAWWGAQSGEAAQFLDLKQVSASVLADFRDSALERLLFGIAAIWLILSLGLRSWRQASKTLLPVLLAIALCVALLGVLDVRLSLFHLIALLLTAGIGIDYSLFFKRSQTSTDEHGANLHSVSVCAASTMAVFAILALSTLPVLRSIGLTVALGVPLCFVFALASARAGVALEKAHR